MVTLCNTTLKHNQPGNYSQVPGINLWEYVTEEFPPVKGFLDVLPLACKGEMRAREKLTLLDTVFSKPAINYI